MKVRTRKRPTRLESELALALDVASRLNVETAKFEKGKGIAWGYPSKFQEKINELLIKAGRKPFVLWDDAVIQDIIAKFSEYIVLDDEDRGILNRILREKLNGSSAQ